MENFTSKIKQRRALGITLLRFFSVILMFYCVVFSGVKSDTSYISGGSYTGRLHTPSAGITRANMDTSHTRHSTADSTTIPVFKGNTTFRGDIIGHDAVYDSTYHRVITSDSAVIPVINGNVTFRGIVTGQDAIYDSTDSRIITADSATVPVLKGAKIIRDTTSFTGGAYFSGIGRFAGTLIAPVADIDSFVGDVKVGGNALINGAITLKNSITVSGVASEVVSEGPFIVLQSPTTSDYSIMQQTLDGIGFYTFSDIHYWDLRMRLSGAGNLTVTGTVTASGFAGPLTGNVTGNSTTATRSDSCTGGAVRATTATTATTASMLYGDTLVDYTSTATTTGWASYTKRSVKYSRTGNFVTVYFNISGESNSTCANISLPIDIYTYDTYIGVACGRNDGTYSTTPYCASINRSSFDQTIAVNTSFYSAWCTFSATGTKEVIGSISYKIGY